MMISIVQHIEYLMMYNDCVVVPGWGALIANYAPSQLQGDTMLKPRRSIGFNPSITHNDGLLATSIARRHGISYSKFQVAFHVLTVKAHFVELGA